MKDQEGQVIRYIDSAAWGITPEGKTIYLGTAEEVKAMVSNPKMCPTSATAAQIIKLERELTIQESNKETVARQKEVQERAERHKRAVALGVAAKTKVKRKLVKLKAKRKLIKTK